MEQLHWPDHKREMARQNYEGRADELVGYLKGELAKTQGNGNGNGHHANGNGHAQPAQSAQPAASAQPQQAAQPATKPQTRGAVRW